MKIALKDGYIHLKEVDSYRYHLFREMGLRWVKSEQVMKGRATLALLNGLAREIILPDHIENLRCKMAATAAAIDKERKSEDPVPLVEYPVKANLFKHQTRGANMALLAFGFRPNDLKNKGGDAT